MISLVMMDNGLSMMVLWSCGGVAVKRFIGRWGMPSWRIQR